jgi:hypothetical protein
MASNLSITMYPEAVYSNTGALIAAGGGTPGNYVSIGTPLLNPARIILFQNGTDGDIMLSFSNGIPIAQPAGPPAISADNLPVLKGSFVLLDVSTNQTEVAGSFNIAQGTQFAAKTLAGAGFTAPTTGAFFITSFYGK